jgi:hypothetical protein
MYPSFAVIEPEQGATLSREQAAFGVADIMTHVLEQYLTATPDVEILDQDKEANLRVVIEAGRRCLANPGDNAAWAYLFYVASWACSDKSMSGTSGAWSAHMIEHELSAATDLNHGNGMAIVFGGWMSYVVEALPAKFARYAQTVWNIPRAGMTDLELGRAGIAKTRAYWAELGIPLTLDRVGIGTEVIAQAARQAVRFGPLGGVRQLGQTDVTAILESVAKG